MLNAEFLRLRRQMVANAAGRRPPKRYRVSPQIFPRALEMDYRGTLLQVVDEMRREVKRVLIPNLARYVAEVAPLHRDAAADDLFGDIGALKLSMGRITRPANLKPLIERVAGRTSDHQKRELNTQIRKAIGVEVPIADPTLAPQIQVFTAENISLIQNLPDKTLGEIQDVVLRGMTDGLRWEEIAGEIEKRVDISADRAATIARDQVGKFYGALNMKRQTNLGVDSFYWETVGDEKVRDLHLDYERQSKVKPFRWDDLPEDGYPGQPINCRCTATPNLSELLDSL